MEQMRADTEDFDSAAAERTAAMAWNGGESGDRSRVARFGSGSVSVARMQQQDGIVADGHRRHHPVFRRRSGSPVFFPPNDSEDEALPPPIGACLPLAM